MAQVRKGDKVSARMGDGRFVPAIALEDAVATIQNYTDRLTGEIGEVTVTRFDALSIRHRKDDNEPYLMVSNETANYGYKVIALPRFTSIVGLDVDEDGKRLSIATLMEQVQAASEAFGLAQFDARNHAVAADAI